MPRKIPAPPESDLADTSTSLVWRISLSLVTPMLGGGHRTKQLDEVTPVSGKAIRGHLRFWWRYMCGSQLTNSAGLPSTELMRLRESEVFGGQDICSPFDILIDDVAGLSPVMHKGGDDAEGYALFPLRDTPSYIAGSGLSFTLVVQWLPTNRLAARESWEADRRKKHNHDHRAPEVNELPPPLEMKQVRDQVNQALWAWINFGGLGSRTRRGLGCLDIGTRSTDFYSFETARRRAPRHSRYPEAYVSPQPFKDASEAWLSAVSHYRDFRQSPRGVPDSKTWIKLDRGLLKRASGRIPGRSRWPEPDSIRMATGCSLTSRRLYLANGAISPTATSEMVEFNDHRTPVATGGVLPAYPRAALGLPIIFHFADGPKIGNTTYQKLASVPSSQRDPEEATLVPMVIDADGSLAPGNRMASPVITKAIKLHDGWHAAILILRPAELEGLQGQLSSSGRHTRIPANQIAGPDVSGFAPMRGRSGALDALGAFLLTRRFSRYGAGQ